MWFIKIIVYNMLFVIEFNKANSSKALLLLGAVMYYLCECALACDAIDLSN